MANIDTYLAQILAAVYGEEVRGSIHDSIKAINEESIAAKEYAEGQKNSAKYYADLAATWSEHPPYIGDNGNWFVYDIPTKEFKDSGIDADRTLTIADITMLDPDKIPDITNTGTVSDPIFHLFIPRGHGISTVEKTSTDGLIDTYTITYSDGATSTFEVKNGKAISKIEKTSSDPATLEDTYTITYNDGTTSSYKVKNGRAISSITKTSSDPNTLEDTYTITYNDNTTSTYKVKNGNGISGISKIKTTGLKDTYKLSFTDSSKSDFEFDVNNGKGIVSIAKTKTEGLKDTYTITFNDETTQTFIVTNGADGEGAVSSVNNISPVEGNITLKAKDVYAIPEQKGSKGQVLGFTSTDTVGPLMVIDSVEDFADNTDETALINAVTISDLLGEQVVSTTLAASGWVNNVYSLETAYPSDKYKLQVYLDTDTCTEEQEKAFNKAKFRPFSVQNNLKCYKEVPTVDIPIIIKIRRIG